MKFKNVFFRKMTILYSLIIGIMVFGIYFVLTEAVTTRVEMDETVRNATLLVSFDTEQKSYKYGEIIERVKTADKLIKVDVTLTGNECLANDKLYRILSVGTEIDLIKDTDYSCVVKGFKKNDIEPYEFVVSQELYDSIKDDKYTYIINVNSYSQLEKLENDKSIDRYGFINLDDSLWNSLYHFDIYNYILIGDVIVLFLIVVVLYINTKGYIKANTKETKKKTKDNTLKLTIGSTLLTLVSGYVCGAIIITIVYEIALNLM